MFPNWDTAVGAASLLLRWVIAKQVKTALEWGNAARRVAVNEGMRSQMGLEQRRQFNWSFAWKRTKVWPVESDMWQPNRCCLIGKRVVLFETHSAGAGTWIQPLAVSLRYICIKIKPEIKSESRGQQMLSCKASSCQIIALEPTFNSAHVNSPRTNAQVKINK